MEDYVRRAADLATLPPGARRAMVLERAADLDDVGAIPADWVPIVVSESPDNG